MTFVRSQRLLPTARFVLVVIACGAPINVFAQASYDAVEHAKALSQAFRQAAQRTSPSVVTIIAKSKIRMVDGRGDLRDLLRDPRFRELLPDEFKIPEDDAEESPDDGPRLRELPDFSSQVGSGVIINAEGLILTNTHVVAGAEDVIVRLPDGRELEAMEIKVDEASDIATLKIKDAGMLRAARIGDSDRLQIGDWVIAIGSPFELEATVSAGIISGKGRGIGQIRGQLLQTDAAINPGNSGGPLVNLDGEVIGINTAIATNSGGYQGIGFAIPINRANWVSNELLAHGEVRRAFLGVRIDDLTPEVGDKLGRPARSGVLVVDVVPDGPALEAGIRKDDIIVEFAGHPVRRARELMDAVEQKPLDSTQVVKVFRDGKTRTFEVSVKAMPTSALRPRLRERE